jgi:hypothetical protein
MVAFYAVIPGKAVGGFISERIQSGHPHGLPPGRSCTELPAKFRISPFFAVQTSGIIPLYP